MMQQPLSIFQLARVNYIQNKAIAIKERVHKDPKLAQ